MDRDGVINERISNDYVKKAEDFVFLPGSLEAIRKFSSFFEEIFIVTNQQGIGKGLMTVEELKLVHDKMNAEIEKTGGKISRIYFCSDLKSTGSIYRKPQVGMGLQAKREYPNLQFKYSFMVGDTRSDMEFGYRLGLCTVLIGSDQKALEKPYIVEACYKNLLDFANDLENYVKK